MRGEPSVIPELPTCHEAQEMPALTAHHGKLNRVASTHVIVLIAKEFLLVCKAS